MPYLDKFGTGYLMSKVQSYFAAKFAGVLALNLSESATVTQDNATTTFTLGYGEFSMEGVSPNAIVFTPNTGDISTSDENVLAEAAAVIVVRSSGGALIIKSDAVRGRYISGITSVRDNNDAANKKYVDDAVSGCAPMYGYGTADLNAGVSKLETGKLYFVYE